MSWKRDLANHLTRHSPRHHMSASRVVDQMGREVSTRQLLGYCEICRCLEQIGPKNIKLDFFEHFRPRLIMFIQAMMKMMMEENNEEIRRARQLQVCPAVAEKRRAL
jgi:hypothetical protein